LKTILILVIIVVAAVAGGYYYWETRPVVEFSLSASIRHDTSLVADSYTK
jgi:uncharacterized protein YxeA